MCGVYLGTQYDCSSTIKFVKKCLEENIPDDALPKKNNYIFL